MTFVRAHVLREQWSRPTTTDSSRRRLSRGTLDRLCKLDMEQHCKRMVHGTAGLRGRGYARMRPKLQLPVLGHALRASGAMA